MKTRNLTILGLFTAIICILGPLAIVLPFSPVPFSLGTLGVILASLILGPKEGLICTVVYLLSGFFGLPVFTGFTGGAGKILGPTGGYLLGYLLLSIIGGKLAVLWHKKPLLQAIALFIGMLTCYLVGTAWLTIQSGLSLSTALWAGVIPYIPFVLAKIGIALYLERKLRRISSRM